MTLEEMSDNIERLLREVQAIRRTLQENCPKCKGSGEIVTGYNKGPKWSPCVCVMD